MRSTLNSNSNSSQNNKQQTQKKDFHQKFVENNKNKIIVEYIRESELGKNYRQNYVVHCDEKTNEFYIIDYSQKYKYIIIPDEPPALPPTPTLPLPPPPPISITLPVPLPPTPTIPPPLPPTSTTAPPLPPVTTKPTLPVLPPPTSTIKFKYGYVDENELKLIDMTDARIDKNDLTKEFCLHDFNKPDRVWVILQPNWEETDSIPYILEEDVDPLEWVVYFEKETNRKYIMDDGTGTIYYLVPNNYKDEFRSQWNSKYKNKLDISLNSSTNKLLQELERISLEENPKRIQQQQSPQSSIPPQSQVQTQIPSSSQQQPAPTPVLATVNNHSTPLLGSLIPTVSPLQKQMMPVKQQLLNDSIVEYVEEDDLKKIDLLNVKVKKDETYNEYYIQDPTMENRKWIILPRDWRNTVTSPYKAEETIDFKKYSIRSDHQNRKFYRDEASNRIYFIVPTIKDPKDSFIYKWQQIDQMLSRSRTIKRDARKPDIQSEHTNRRSKSASSTNQVNDLQSSPRPLHLLLIEKQKQKSSKKHDEHDSPMRPRQRSSSNDRLDRNTDKNMQATKQNPSMNPHERQNLTNILIHGHQKSNSMESLLDQKPVPPLPSKKSVYFNENVTVREGQNEYHGTYNDISPRYGQTIPQPLHDNIRQAPMPTNRANVPVAKPRQTKQNGQNEINTHYEVTYDDDVNQLYSTVPPKNKEPLYIKQQGRMGHKLYK